MDFFKEFGMSKEDFVAECKQRLTITKQMCDSMYAQDDRDFEEIYILEMDMEETMKLILELETA